MEKSLEESDSSLMIAWRKAVFQRDNHTCQKCGVRGKYLEAHHIKTFALFPELRFELTNGITLCKPCHKLTDTFGYRKFNSLIYKEMKNSQKMFDSEGTPLGKADVGK